MKKRTDIGYSIKMLNNVLKRRIANIKVITDTDRLTGMHSWIIGYIYNQSNTEGVLQRDLEEKFTIRRSTATGILKLMEKNDLIKREAVDYDARLKKITLTPKAIAIHEEIMSEFMKVEEELTQGITEEELEVFVAVLNKMKNNLEEKS